MPNRGERPPPTTKHEQADSVKRPGEDGNDEQRQPPRIAGATRRVSGSSPLGGANPQLRGLRAGPFKITPTLYPFVGTRSLQRLQDRRSAGGSDLPAEVAILRHRHLRVPSWSAAARALRPASSISEPTVLRNVCEVIPG
jgi:hypothetical protein